MKLVPDAPLKRSWHRVMLRQALWISENLAPLADAESYAGITLVRGSDVASLTSADKDVVELCFVPGAAPDRLRISIIDDSGQDMEPAYLQDIDLYRLRTIFSDQLGFDLTGILEAGAETLRTGERVNLGWNDSILLRNNGLRRFYDNFLPREFVKITGKPAPEMTTEHGLVLSDQLDGRPAPMLGFR
jgi:hypothetical protein